MTALPDWLMERAVLDEVPTHARAWVAEVRNTPDYAQRERALAADNRRVLAALPMAEVVAEIERRCAAHEANDKVIARVRRWQVAVPLLVGASAIVALILWSRAPGSAPEQQSERPGPLVAHVEDRAKTGIDEEHRAKGAPRLVIHKRIGAGSQSLMSGAQVRAGDQLQLYYQSGGIRTGRFAAILSVDGRGTVTVHLPDVDSDALDTAQAVPVTEAGLTPLGHSYELDDAPLYEHFVLVTGDRPFAIADVVTAARALIADPLLVASRPSDITLDLAPGLEQTWFMLGKGVYP